LSNFVGIVNVPVPVDHITRLEYSHEPHESLKTDVNPILAIMNAIRRGVSDQNVQITPV
jgi:hypothetical protein